MDAAALLNGTLSPTASDRKAATAQLLHFQSTSPAQYLLSLSAALASAATPSHLRNAAGLAVKNALSARDSARQEEFAANWKALPEPTREQLKQQVLATLADQDKAARSVSAQVLAAIAAIEIPAALWNGLIPQLLQLVGQPDNAGLRQATLQTIGYICESIVRLFFSRNQRRENAHVVSLLLRNRSFSRLSRMRFSPPSSRVLARRNPGAFRPLVVSLLY